MPVVLKRYAADCDQVLGILPQNRIKEPRQAMKDNLIPIDDSLGDQAEDLQKLMKLVDPHQREDRDLARLLLVRLKLDGLERTRAYLVEKTTKRSGHIIKCPQKDCKYKRKAEPQEDTGAADESS